MADIPNIVNRFAIVKQIPIFHKLNWFDLQKIARKATVVEYKKGDIIYCQGDPPNNFFCLISGRLQAYTIRPDGVKENVEFIYRGMHFGIISLLTGENHSLNFKAINDAIVLQIPKDDFHSILNDIPALGIELSHSLSQRVRTNVIRPKYIFESTIISVYSPSRGSGNSAYAINLALSLQKETGKKVAFINVTPRVREGSSSASDLKEASPQWKMPAVDISRINGDYEKVNNSITHDGLNIALLNVCFDSQSPGQGKEIGRFVVKLADDYHYIVVDLPNGMPETALKTLSESDLVQIVVSNEEKELRLANEAIGQLKSVLKENFIESKVHVIINTPNTSGNLPHEDASRILIHPLYYRLPQINHLELKNAIVSESFTVITPDPASEYAKAVTRISRRIGGVLVGLVLGGGAALGIAHIGVIRVLESENIPVDIVVGSSMGALIASLWVTGKKAKEIEVLAREFSDRNAIFKLLDLVFPISGLVGGRAINGWLKRHLGNKTFQDIEVPFKIVAYDLIHREELVLDKGLLVDAVRKSIAIPGVIEPIKEEGRVIIDGGVLNPLPTNVLTQMGIKKIIAVNVLQSPQDVSSGYELAQARWAGEGRVSFWASPLRFVTTKIKRTLRKMFTPNISDIMVSTLMATEYVISEQNAEQADVVIHPDLVGVNWFDLYRVDEIIRKGEEATRKILPDIKRMIEES
ncbi:MAG: patatin-like phospholipase family protein [Candidatus Omnitrophota bacterium]